MENYNISYGQLTELCSYIFPLTPNPNLGIMLTNPFREMAWLRNY